MRQPMTKTQKTKTCPQCGGDHDDRTDAIEVCIKCGRRGSTACCLPDGDGTTCEDCRGEFEREWRGR